MSRKRRKTKARQPAPKPSKARKVLNIALPVLAVAVLAIVAYLFFLSDKRAPISTPSFAGRTLTAPKVARKAETLNELLELPLEELNQVDIAEMNLLCATGLPGSEKLDVGKAFTRLDEYARRVRYWTDESMWDFRQNPGKFENSEAKFRALLLISVLQKDFGVHYNDRGERNCDFSSSKNPFIHGMIDDTNGGTCASMPVMYVAVARRLGYPMSLVLAKTHIFARWDDGTERFNIEGTNPRFDDYPDSYYRKWPYPISDAELKQGWYLKSLTPAEELAVFLQNRGACLMDKGRYAEARNAYARAYRLAPQDPLGRMRIASAWAAARPTRGPEFRHVPGVGLVDEDGIPMVYRNPMLDVQRINEINRRNRERMMRAPQPHHPTIPGAPRPPMGYVPTPPYTPPNPHARQHPHQPRRPQRIE